MLICSGRAQATSSPISRPGEDRARPCAGPRRRAGDAGAGPGEPRGAAAEVRGDRAPALRLPGDRRGCLPQSCLQGHRRGNRYALLIGGVLSCYARKQQKAERSRTDLMHPSCCAREGRWWPWLGLPLILAGCLYRAHYVSHGEGASLDRSETSPDLVKVVTAKDVDRPYRKIGVVHAPASLSERDAIAALQRRARTLGGDGLLGLPREGTGPRPRRGASGAAAPPPPGAKPPAARVPAIPILPNP